MTLFRIGQDVAAGVLIYSAFGFGNISWGLAVVFYVGVITFYRWKADEV